jgi:hypothetical protein
MSTEDLFGTIFAGMATIYVADKLSKTRDSQPQKRRKVKRKAKRKVSKRKN